MGKVNRREQVERGAELLDRVRPGWFRRIDLDELEMNDGCHCILGQLARTSRAPSVRQELAQGVSGYGAYLSYLWERGHKVRGSVIGCLPTEYPSRLYEEEWARVIGERLL